MKFLIKHHFYVKMMLNYVLNSMHVSLAIEFAININ